MGYEGVDYNKVIGLLDKSYTSSNLVPGPPVYAGNSTYDTLGPTSTQSRGQCRPSKKGDPIPG